ncbi:hypothetical protein AAF712_001837 [Marasmius tenuissimus]|uniref:cutinase n=1 Tax=Marasmius tenuissimus TaxID=585030 RepID=A0ABR3ABD1_9AGAR|nr:hypothetical protein PM082_008020 [Marasmius tenuissimus]
MAPAFRLAVAALALISSVFAAPLEERQACADVIVIYARGTTQQSPIGDSASVGALFRDNIRSRLGSRTLTFQGVDYPANIAGFLAGGDPAGSRTMAADITSAANSCPNAKIVSAGYSQGAQLVHNSAKMLTSAVTNRISAVVTFGDPYQNQAVGSVPSSKVLVVCHNGDNICEGGINPTGPHTTYQQDAPAAAQFVISKV